MRGVFSESAVEALPLFGSVCSVFDAGSDPLDELFSDLLQPEKRNCAAASTTAKNVIA
jgi:hypothetical protein